MDSEVFGSRRFNLDGPPPRPDLRTSPDSPATPETLYDSSSGSVTRNDERQNTGDMGVQQIASRFAILAQIESLLDDLTSTMPRLLPICEDFVTTLRQAVPQEIANMQSMSPMSRAGAPGNVTNQLSSLFGGGGAGAQTPAPISGPSPIAGVNASGAGGVMGM